MLHRIIPSPIGPLTIIADERGITAINFGAENVSGEQAPAGAAPMLDEAERQLCEYFAGSRRTFDLQLVFQGTSFQVEVWRSLTEIPYGATASYGEIAQRLGNPGAVRAVGSANNRNPLPIVVPCHRVIGTDGELIGYAGGLDIKKALLMLEGSLKPNSQMSLFE